MILNGGNGHEADERGHDEKDMPVKDALADKYAGSFIDTAIFS